MYVISVYWGMNYIVAGKKKEMSFYPTMKSLIHRDTCIGLHSVCYLTIYNVSILNGRVMYF